MPMLPKSRKAYIENIFFDKVRDIERELRKRASKIHQKEFLENRHKLAQMPYSEFNGWGRLETYLKIPTQLEIYNELYKGKQIVIDELREELTKTLLFGSKDKELLTKLESIVNKLDGLMK